MRVLYVTGDWLHRTRHGGSIRRNGLVGSLRDAGHTVDVVSVAHLAHLGTFATRFAGVDWARHLPFLPNYEIVHVEGLPLHWLTAKLASAGRRSVWDLCDSWALKYASEFSQSLAIRDFFSCTASYACLVHGSGTGVARLYIADRDRAIDSKLPFLHGPTFVVPNGGAADILVSERTAQGPIILGDWRYPPNRRGIDWLDSEIRSSGGRAPSSVRVFGLAAEELPNYSWAQRVGYVDDLAEVYATASFVLAPIVTGAGVKNKVLEAASLGLPVLTTKEGIAGMTSVPPWVAVENSGSAFLRRWSVWSSTSPTCLEDDLARYRRLTSWEVSVQNLLAAYDFGQR